MVLLGYISQLWRYPVKSMQGESCSTLTVDALGIVGDRRFAFESAAAPLGKPLLHSSERTAMLRSRARHDAASHVTVHTPAGTILSIHDDDLPRQTLAGSSLASEPHLITSTKPLTDVRPISLHSLATARQLQQELGSFDDRRLRSNLILDLCDPRPFAEDDLATNTIQLGAHARLTLLERIPRCRIVSLDPETAQPSPGLLRELGRLHQGRAGIYARPLHPGIIHLGDPVWRLD